MPGPRSRSSRTPGRSATLIAEIGLDDPPVGLPDLWVRVRLDPPCTTVSRRGQFIETPWRRRSAPKPNCSGRQRQGDLPGAAGRAFRRRVRAVGLEQAHAETDVVVAAEAGFTDQASLLLGLGPTDPPIRLREVLLDGWPCAQAGGGGGTISSCRWPAAARRCWPGCWRGPRGPGRPRGEGTPLQPRAGTPHAPGAGRVGVARLTLQRGISENGWWR